MYSFPDLFEQSVEEVNSLPATFVATPEGFSSINLLEEDVFVLTTYSISDSKRKIAVKNLKNDSIYKEWEVKNPFEETARIVHPLYLNDGSIIYYFTYKWKMIKLDSNGNEVWKRNDIVFHHGMELNAEGDIWACTKQPGPYKNGLMKTWNQPRHFLDYTITKIDVETGKTLFEKSICDILIENDLQNYLLKSHKLVDPIHLNDVQPALKTTEFYQKGDVFVSLRTISAILHYRPSTNELIDLIEGPFVSQHDIDFLNDSTLSILNNNFFPGSYKETNEKPEGMTQTKDVGSFKNEIVTYNFNSKQFSVIGDSIIRANDIHTDTEGVQEHLGDGVFFMEQQNHGLLWVISEDEVIYKNVFKSQHDGYHHLPNWTRVIDFP